MTTRGARVGISIGLVLIALAAPRIARAQGASVPETHWVQPELRADVIAARATSVELAGALSIPMGTYLRVSVAAGGGASWYRGESGASQRLDATGRFVLDPFQQSRWAPYGIGGASLRHDPWLGWRPLLVLGVGVQGPARGGAVTALEASLGGGVRVGLAIRRAIRDRR